MNVSETIQKLIKVGVTNIGHINEQLNKLKDPENQDFKAITISHTQVNKIKQDFLISSKFYAITMMVPLKELIEMLLSGAKQDVEKNKDETEIQNAIVLIKKLESVLQEINKFESECPGYFKDKE
jgi:hypothetical protein